MNEEFIKELTIRFSETDNCGYMKPLSIFDCFQDIGCEHAADMGLAAVDLIAKNYTWVMLRYNVDIHRAPFWNERVTVKSWRHPHKNLYELRRFEIYDAAETLIIDGLSSWVMVEYQTKRPVRLSRFMTEELLTSGKPLEENFLKIPRLEKHTCEKILNVRMQDIDYNNHVNNSVYIGWAIEAIPQAVFSDCKLVHVDVSYTREISYGNKIYSRVEPLKTGDNPEFLHCIYGGDEKKELTRLKTIWNNNIPKGISL